MPMGEESRSEEIQPWLMQLMPTFRLRDSSGREIHSRSKRLIAMLCLLALRTDGRADREELANAVYWDSTDDAEAKLSVLLSRSGRPLGDERGCILQYSPQMVSLDKSLIQVDLWSLSDLIERVEQAGRSQGSVRHLFEQMGRFVAPINLVDYGAPVGKAVQAYKHLLLSRIQTNLVPVAGTLYADELYSLIETLGLEEPLSQVSCVRLMEIYSGIGDRASVHRVFADHEDALQFEYGESVSQATVEAYRYALANSAYPGIDPVIGRVPAEPSYSVGFDEIITKLEGSLELSRAGDVYQLSGRSGSGKTHLLTKLFHRLGGDKAAFVDAHDLENPQACRESAISKRKFLLIDNLDSSNFKLISTLNGVLPKSVLVVATDSKFSIEGCINIPIPILETGTRFDAGPGHHLLVHSIQETSTGEKRSTELDAVLIDELCGLAGGNPGTIIQMASLVRTIGLRETVTLVQSQIASLSSISSQRLNLYVRQEAVNVLESLPPSQLACCSILVKLGHPTPAEVLVEAGEILPQDIDALNARGLIVRGLNSVVSVSRPYSDVLKSSGKFALSEQEWTKFARGVSLWAARVSDERDKNLHLVVSFDSLVNICIWLLEQDDPDIGLQMFASLSKWFGSVNIIEALPAKVESLLVEGASLDLNRWRDSVCAVGSAYFFSGASRRMDEFLAWAIGTNRYKSLDNDSQAMIVNQRGLSQRCVGKYSDAVKSLNRAIELSNDPSLLVKTYFNLGCLYEIQEDLANALKYYELATQHYDSSTEWRLSVMNTGSVIRLRQALFGDEVPSIQLAVEMLRECQKMHDLRSQSFLLSFVGEQEVVSGRLNDGAHLISIGGLMGLKLSYSRSTELLIVDSLRVLSECLGQMGEAVLSDRALVLADALDADIIMPGGVDDTSLGGAARMQEVLHELYCQILELVDMTQVSTPPYIKLIIEEWGVLDVRNSGFVPTVSYIESLRTRLKMVCQGATVQSQNQPEATRSR